jgi:hypothetical protein
MVVTKREKDQQKSDVNILGIFKQKGRGMRGLRGKRTPSIQLLIKSISY